MKISDIKVGNIYYVDYEPVRNGEFNGLHLSVVLKKNNDKHTFVVMPLTSSANGDGVNKINIGKVAALPPNINHKDTYAVFNQVRTVNASRFRAVKNDSGRVNVTMDNEIMCKLYDLLLCDVLYNVTSNDKISILKNAYDKERFNKAKDMAYAIIKLRKSETNEAKATVLKTSIREILKDASYTLDAAQIADGIQRIFDEAINDKR